jgi:hypothetical protein
VETNSLTERQTAGAALMTAPSSALRALPSVPHAPPGRQRAPAEAPLPVRIHGTDAAISTSDAHIAAICRVRPGNREDTQIPTFYHRLYRSTGLPGWNAKQKKAACGPSPPRHLGDATPVMGRRRPTAHSAACRSPPGRIGDIVGEISALGVLPAEDRSTTTGPAAGASAAVPARQAEEDQVKAPVWSRARDPGPCAGGELALGVGRDRLVIAGAEVPGGQ